jgi:DNA-binding IclR family transcriptional regulator
LSYLPPEVTRSALEIELARQPDAIEARYAVERVVREVRENGFARIDGSVVPGLRAIAAPILDLQGDLRACIALVSPSESLVRVPNPILDDLLDTARATSRGLGWPGQP